MKLFLSIICEHAALALVAARLRRMLFRMRVILSVLIYLVTINFRTRSSLELEVIALRHQLAVLRRTKKQPPLITSGDRFIGVGFIASILQRFSGCGS